VAVAFFCGGGDAGGEDLFGFGGAGFTGQELTVHQIGGDVIGVVLEEGAEMGVGGGGIAAVHALHGEAVAGEGVVGLFGYELFEHLAAGFLLVGHGVSRIIRGRKEKDNAETQRARSYAERRRYG
jgi:hypothetical protein